MTNKLLGTLNMIDGINVKDEKFQMLRLSKNK